MYLKELYKSRKVDSYEGYDTIYNNEPRLKLPELLDHMEQFTEIYKKYKDAHPAIREAACFDAQYPAMMLEVADNDLFVGRADIFPLGFNAQYINSDWGFVLNKPWFDEQQQNEDVTKEQKTRLRELADYWSDKTSMQRFTATMDPVHALYLINGGVEDNTRMYYDKPNGAIAGSRVAGVFLDFEKLLSYGLQGLIDLTYEKEKTAENHNPELFEGMRRQVGTIQKTLNWYADEIDKMILSEEREERKSQLELMSAICRKLVNDKPETFREAIQLVLIYAIMDGAREWGRICQIL